MNSPRWIRLPLLDKENPLDGFHHFAKLQRDFESVEDYLEYNKYEEVPAYLFRHLARSYKELGTKIDLSKATDSDDENEPGEIQDQHPSASLNKFIPSSSRDSTKHLNRPNDRTYTVLATNYETNEWNLSDLSSGFEPAARFIFNENATRLSSLKNVEDIKNIRWNKLNVSGKERSSLLIEFRTSQIANEVIARGLCTGSRLHDCSMYDKLCSNCYTYGHSVKLCSRPTRCARCAENHPTKSCKSTLCACAICGNNHASLHCTTLEKMRRPKTYYGTQRCGKRLWPFESDSKIEEPDIKPSPSMSPPLKNEFKAKRMMTRSQSAEAKRIMTRSKIAEATFVYFKEEPLSNQ